MDSHISCWVSTFCLLDSPYPATFMRLGRLFMRAGPTLHAAGPTFYATGPTFYADGPTSFVALGRGAPAQHQLRLNAEVRLHALRWQQSASAGERRAGSGHHNASSPPTSGLVLTMGLPSLQRPSISTPPTESMRVTGCKPCRQGGCPAARAPRRYREGKVRHCLPAGILVQLRWRGEYGT